MTEPRTSVDPRFSQAGAEPTSWAVTQDAIAAAELFWIATVREDGRPHVTPLVAVWHDDALYFATGSEEQKALNLSTNRHVALTTGRNEWEHGLDVVVEGEANRVLSRDELLTVAEVWRHKWDGGWDYAVDEDCFHNRDGETVYDGDVYVFKVVPTKVLAFSKGPYSHTRHQF